MAEIRFNPNGPTIPEAVEVAIAYTAGCAEGILVGLRSGDDPDVYCLLLPNAEEAARLAIGVTFNATIKWGPEVKEASEKVEVEIAEALNAAKRAQNAREQN